MKLSELIKSYNWLSVELTLLKLYPDHNQMLDEYRKVYEKLKVTEPADYDELEIILTEYDSDPDFDSDKETYVDVLGQKKNSDPNDISNSYAIEFLEWDKWLGMDLALQTTKNFSDLEIIAHCLYEMTFIDYDEDVIQQQLKSLTDTVEEYKKLTDEERKQKTISFEEFKRRLDDKKDSK